ncbi:MAG: hypothetical protein KAS53_06165 [Candidatus Cloacimonetes bacterium]|nr:hypothetical protein [Candidatus Cloacimonadota bacterium]
MKKVLVILILTLMIVGSLHAETKFKMELWNRWTYQMSDGEVTKNEMALKRGYFRLEPKFSEDIKGRFNLDFFSDDDNKVADGAGLKIKYAYLDFNNLLPIKDSKLTIGLMQTYFGTIYEWNYTTIEGDPSDIYKFVSSTDFGFGVSGKIPNEFGSYNLAIYNGEGYKNVGKNINTDMNFAANFRITTFNSVILGGSYMYRTEKNSDADNREEYNLIAGIGKFAFGDFTVLAEYLYKVKSLPNTDSEEDNVKSSVITIMPVYKINDKFELLARYDIYDPDKDADNDVENTIIAGLNYHIMRDANNAPKLFVQTNYKITQYEADNEEDVQEILVQLRWIFSEVINKN